MLPQVHPASSLGSPPPAEGQAVSTAPSFPPTYNKKPNEIMKQTHFNATKGIVLLLKQQIELIESAGEKKNGEKERIGPVHRQKGRIGV